MKMMTILVLVLSSQCVLASSVVFNSDFSTEEKKSIVYELNERCQGLEYVKLTEKYFSSRREYPGAQETEYHNLIVFNVESREGQEGSLAVHYVFNSGEELLKLSSITTNADHMIHCQ